MVLYNNMVIPKPSIYKVKNKKFDDNIYTFDIETISLFKIDDKWQPFDYSKDSEFYKTVEKACCPYIWQFSINSCVYYGREFMDFENVLKWLSDDEVEKFIYCHNLSYEMQFLIDIIEKNNWHISGMVARNIRQPIAFHIDEINITFKCSYMLTNLSLEAAAEKYTNVKKAVGYLDYNTAYSPYSQLPDEVLYYCEMDCVTLYEVIKAFRSEYNHIKSVPLTQTGEVRRSLRQYIDFYYIKKQWALVPDHVMYCILMAAFQGGITHANMLNANRVIKGDIWSYDFCSSYPYCMVAYKFPSEPFFSITLSEVDRMKDKYLFLYDITLVNVRANKHNHYLSYSKLTEVVDDPTGEYKKCVDNGRLVKCKSCRITCTNYDLVCILQCYDCEVVYNHIWASYAKYLDKRVIEFILDRYVAKTELKGVSEDSEQFKFYMKMKQELNSVYGMAVTNPLKTGIEFDCLNGWSSHAINDMVDDGSGNSVMFIDKKLHDMKKSYSTLFYYAVGVFVTAIARYNLWQAIMQLDSEVIYYDTDSIKGIGAAVVNVVENYNNNVLERLHEAAEACEIDINRYMPADRNGVKHPLGIFECETWDNKNNCPAYYTEFKTMGAKKYVYRDSKGVLHMTVSGVRKSAVSALDNDINNFRKGFKFGYKAADKLIHYYTDEQTPFEYRDVQGNIYRCSQKHAIILQPTTYTIGITDIYESLLALASGHIGYIG